MASEEFATDFIPIDVLRRCLWGSAWQMDWIMETGRVPGARSGDADGDAVFLEMLLEFAGLEHLGDDVAAADELTLDVELG